MRLDSVMVVVTAVAILLCVTVVSHERRNAESIGDSAARIANALERIERQLEQKGCPGGGR